jgi:hypothetical protein
MANSKVLTLTTRELFRMIWKEKMKTYVFVFSQKNLAVHYDDLSN